jgi:hypothetical protein
MDHNKVLIRFSNFSKIESKIAALALILKENVLILENIHILFINNTQNSGLFYLDKNNLMKI